MHSACTHFNKNNNSSSHHCLMAPSQPIWHHLLSEWVGDENYILYLPFYALNPLGEPHCWLLGICDHNNILLYAQNVFLLKSSLLPLRHAFKYYKVMIVYSNAPLANNDWFLYDFFHCWHHVAALEGAEDCTFVLKTQFTVLLVAFRSGQAGGTMHRSGCINGHYPVHQIKSHKLQIYSLMQ